MQSQILKTLKQLPDQAGVYQYFDAKKRLLYVGKAKNLKKRLKSYWRFRPQFRPNPNLGKRTIKMLEEATLVEYMVVESESDALILENSLIKQLNPKYNILLRDDKTYPYIYLDEKQDFPHFELTRSVIKEKGILYYGPFPTGAKVLLDTLYEIFPLVQKKSCLKEKRACLFYQMGRCLAPCEGKVGKEEYAKIVSKAKKAIVKREILVKVLHQKMINLATAQRFEEAGKLRDNIKSLETLTISSNLDLVSDEDIDIFAILNGSQKGVIIKLFIRAGKLISSSSSPFNISESFDIDEAYKQVLLAFYTQERPQIAKTILVADGFKEQSELSQLLSKRFAQKVTIHQPKKGAKRKLMEIALTNAREILKNRANPKEEIEREVAELFELQEIPSQVESFDNSHMMGVATVGAMVVYSNGEWVKKDYRRYALESRDEYGQMREMLTRRIQSFTKSSVPNLWILDGGETLRRLATKLLEDAHINLDVIAIAKEKIDAKAHRAKGSAKDIIYTQNAVFKLPTKDKRLQWVQRQRDEAHRFAVAYHQNRKRKEDRRGRLLEKKGIGPATVKKLINYFGTFQAIENATYDEISVVSSEKIAKILKT